MANNVYAFTALTGGAAGALDAIAGAILATGDLAFGIADGKILAYKFDSTSSATESSPEIIAPDSGNGRWLLATNHYKMGSFTRVLNAQDGNVSYTGVGFKPSALIIIGSISGTKYFTVGLTSAIAGGVIFVFLSDSNYGLVANRCVEFHSGAAAEGASLASFDNDGFTLAWANDAGGINATGSCYYLAFR